MRIARLILLILISGWLTDPALAQDFLQFRGPQARNVIPESEVSQTTPIQWGLNQNLAWKVPLPGRAVNGVIVVDGKVIATSASGAQQDRLQVWALDEASGAIRWKRTIYSTGRTFCHPLSSMAAPTPVSDGNSIFALFATNDLVCLDLQGNLRWTRALGLEFPVAFDDRGFASSPVIVDGTLMVQLACQGDSFVLGIDPLTGQTRWRKDLARITAWTSPTPFEMDGKNYVLIQSAKDLQILEPKSGEVRWRYEAQGTLIPSPTAIENAIFIASAGLTRLDVDLKSPTLTKVWSEPRLGSSGGSPVVDGDQVYLIRNNNVLTCGDAQTGGTVWQLRMKGSRMWATPLLIGKRLYVVNDAGLTQVVDVSGEQGRLLAENDLAEEVLGSPAYSRGAIFLRGVSHVFKVAETADSDLVKPAHDSTSEPKASDNEAIKRALQSALDEILKREPFPGATLAVQLPDQTVLELSSGWQDREQQIAMPSNARMLVGSVGKTFVSAVVLQLVSEGKIKLDAKVAEYLNDQNGMGWFSRIPNADSLTIRSLLNHTSGLPRYIFTPGFLAAVKEAPYRKWTPAEQLEFIQGLPAVHPVGAGWGYSDTNYLILGLVIESVSGASFYEEAQRRLLDPLKLTHTVPSNQPELSGLVPGYIGDTNFFSLPEKTVVEGRYVMDPGFEWCGGGFLSNTSDLARWANALYGGKVLEADRFRELISAVSMRTGQSADAGYGLGCFVWQTELGPFFGHAGIMPGYVTQVEYSVDHQFSIALQVNTDQGLGQNLHGHCQQLAGIVVQNGSKSARNSDSD